MSCTRVEKGTSTEPDRVRMMFAFRWRVELLGALTRSTLTSSLLSQGQGLQAYPRKRFSRVRALSGLSRSVLRGSSVNPCRHHPMPPPRWVPTSLATRCLPFGGIRFPGAVEHCTHGVNVGRGSVLVTRVNPRFLGLSSRSVCYSHKFRSLS